MGIVVVTGAPGSGKSTLARPLAAALGRSLIEKDTIKEALGDVLGRVDRDGQRELSGAAFAVIDALLPTLVDAVVEGNVYPGSPLAAHLAALPDAVEVHCRCPLAICRDRFVGRTDRHRVHSGGDPTIAVLATFELPLGLATVIEVDTSAPVDVEDLVDRVRRVLAG